MNILALDIANFSSSLALMKNNEIAGFFYDKEFRGQDVHLLQRLEGLLQENQLDFKDLDLIVATTGPGSFTGIRVGLATIQGLALAAEVPAIGINSFEWILHSYLDKNHIDTNTFLNTLVVLESLRLEQYVCLFNNQGKLVGGATSLAPDDIIGKYSNIDVVCIGNGAHHLADKKVSASKLIVKPFMADARDLANYAIKIKDYTSKDYKCLPTYIRGADISKPKSKT